MTTVKLNTNYGGLIKFRDYKQVGEGLDYIVIKHQGNRLHVPISLVATDKDLYYQSQEEEIEDDEDWEYDDF